MTTTTPRMLLVLIAVATMAHSNNTADAQPAINTGSLLREMYDMQRLTELPSPAYKTVQYSSYDRRSSVPNGPGWFANADGFGGEPIPGFLSVVSEPNEQGIGEYLICDVQTPGVIVRTWTAAMGGTLKVTLDGNETPLYEGPTADFLFSPYHALANAHSQDESLAAPGTFQQHEASYCPIPFAEGCRITWTGKLREVHFYQIQIREYEPDADVQTFQLSDLTTYADDLETAQRILNAPGAEYAYADDQPIHSMAVNINGHEKIDVLNLDGPGAIERLTLKVSAANVEHALRQVVLEIYFDGYPWPQVEAPVGDFFGAAPGINPLDSMPFTVEPDGTMTCRYVMPFASSVRVALSNHGDQPVTVTGSVAPMSYEWTDRSLHFRARWRVDHDVVGWSQAPQDLPFLLANGAGRYVGTSSMLLNPTNITTPWGSWWGEGDEKIFVDDDRVPSTFGTGSEDYYNYAWSVPEIFTFAYCGQPRNDGPGNRGFVTNNRWHIIDDLPFASRIAFYMELFPHSRVPGMSYARIGYHYARPGCYDDHVIITDEDVRILERPENWQPAASYILQDATIYSVEDLLSITPAMRIIRDHFWAGGQVLAWQPPRVGDSLHIRITVPEDGKYQLYLGCGLTPGAGRITFAMDENPINIEGHGEQVDLYVPYRTLERQFATPVMNLTAGEHGLTVTFAGAPDSVSTPMICLDYLACKKR
ncbi:MAG: DUF2961 domain-containing protein [Planctomycetes bacterium]|nr:DUF2961 domain-containing protein [Planctomycetota bacterium]NOG56063.1 DUF2961 domain-containing protein [Planctomycetota bacterium]